MKAATLLERPAPTTRPTKDAMRNANEDAPAPWNLGKFSPQLQEKIRELDPARLPAHVAMICDGNGRWATRRGLPRPMGHHQGYLATRRVVRAASDLGVRVLTLYAFSTENWTRPEMEVTGLMRLFEEGAQRELSELHANGVRMRFSGRIHELPASLQEKLAINEAKTRHNTGMTLNVCLNYSGRAEIVDAVQRLVERACRQELCGKDVTPELIASELTTAGLPDPDLLIRTAGELRVSNYLLWQIAYAELHVTQTLWPDFDAPHLIDALLDYQQRTRRFGGVVAETKK
jgi:undecaprenyl diphosphate synthase